jgi:hypothetical protein
MARTELGAGRCHGALGIALPGACPECVLAAPRQAARAATRAAGQLAGAIERISGVSPSSTRQALVYLLHLSGFSEADWRQALQSHGTLRNQAATVNDKHLSQLQAQLRHRADSYLAPYVAFHYLRLHPSAHRCSIRLPRALPASSSPPPNSAAPARTARQGPCSSSRSPRPRLHPGRPTRAARGPEQPAGSLHASRLLGLIRALPGRKLARARRLPAFHQDAGFSILSVSFDEKQAAWQQAMQQDALL